MLDGREQGADALHLRVELGRIIKAVRSVVPQSMWGEIARKLEGDDEVAEPSEVEDSEALEPDDDPFDADDFDELRDPRRVESAHRCQEPLARPPANAEGAG